MMGCKSPVESDGPSPGTSAYWRQLFQISQESGVLKNNLHFLGCVRDRKLAIGRLAFISTPSSSWTSNRDARDKQGKIEGESDTGLTAHDPSKSRHEQGLFSPEPQRLF